MSHGLTQTLEILRKELAHVLRDRRTVVSTQLYAILGPVFLTGTLSAMSGDPDRPSRVGVVGSAPHLLHALELSGLETEPLDSAPLDEEALEPHNAVLRIPSDFAQRRKSRKSITVELFVGDGPDSKRAERRVARAINRYAGHIGSTELLRRGVPTSVAYPLRVSSIELSGSSRNAQFATLLMLYIVLAPFLAGTGAAIDTATGERERGTLALMRLQPLSPFAWVTAKWLVVVAFAWAGAVVTTIVSVLALFRFAPSLASSLALTPLNVPALCLAAFPVTLVASAMSFGLALQARSTMEAQTRLTLASLVPVGVGLLATAGAAPSTPGIPILHELTQLPAWLSGSAFPAELTVLTTLNSAILIVAILYWGSKRIMSEQYWVA